MYQLSFGAKASGNVSKTVSTLVSTSFSSLLRLVLLLISSGKNTPIVI